MTTVTYDALDALATDLKGPVALFLRQQMQPVEGEGGVIFPPTYADIGYNIDETPEGVKTATIDSVGSQANRIEPMFYHRDTPEPRMAALVPQIDITYTTKESNKTRFVSIFEAGHRLGDAIIRSTALREEAHDAFAIFGTHGDASKIAKLAPTSLVFGAWDSRDTQAKLPRLLQSVIRAEDVAPLTRSAVYTPAIDYAAAETFSEEEKQKAEDSTKSPQAQKGYVHVPAGKTHGGVIARGPITRTVTVNLVALRRLSGGDDPDLLRRYVLGLALAAATADQDGFLRSGCMLVPDIDHPAGWELVARNGRRSAFDLDHETALDYAEAVAAEMGVAALREVAFDKKLAKDDIKKKD